jgi:hypothetical protein
MIKNFLVLVLSWILLLPLEVKAQKEFTTEDRTYHKNIRTVLLYPATGAIEDPLRTSWAPRFRIIM